MAIHNHTTPREYLKHFATNDDPEKTWRYDIKDRKWELLPVEIVGQRSDFYSMEMEISLNSKIEAPAQSHFNRLRRGEQVDGAGRLAVARYVVNMATRVERTREKMADSLQREITQIMEAPEEWAIKWNVPEDILLDHLEQKEQSLLGDPLRTKDPVLRTVLELPNALALIMDMNWHVFAVDTIDRILTSDNPVFVGAQRLKPPHGEFFFPLASKVAMVGNWKGAKEGLTYLSANSRFVKEFNRYVVAGADRWLYFHEKADWVTKMVKNPSTNTNPFG